MPQKSKIDAPGALHHIIVRGIERRMIFVDDMDRNNFLDRTGGMGTRGTGIDILIGMIQFARYLHLVYHEKPEWLLRAPFTISSRVESSAKKSFGMIEIETPW